MAKKVSLFLLVFIPLMLAAAKSPVPTNGPFAFGGMQVPAGQMRSFSLPVPAGVDAGTEIPVTVINGQKPGNVLALVAGVHACEYPPILALYRLKESIDPKNLSGTLILVHIANLPSFQKRTIYYNPYDWKNLNRVFPGNPNGTITQRIASILTREVIERCDALIDLHCGDGNEALIPYSYWMISDNPALDEQTKRMAVAFGLKYIIIDRSRGKDIADSKYLGNTALLRSKPAITTEMGLLGRTDEDAVRGNLQGIENVLRLFQMLPGEVRSLCEPVWVDQYEVIYSSVAGLFHPLTQMGYHAAKDELVGYVTDYAGQRVLDVRSPFAGIILYIINTPPVAAGEPLFEVGRIKE